MASAHKRKADSALGDLADRDAPAPEPDKFAARVDKDFVNLHHAAWHVRTTRKGWDIEEAAMKRLTTQAQILLDNGYNLHAVLRQVVRSIKA